MRVNFICLNPSTADENVEDPTIRRCIGFAKAWGYGGLYITNIFAYRATLPKDMKTQNDPVGFDNDDVIMDTYKKSDMNLAAWGKDGEYRNRAADVVKMCGQLYCLKTSEKTGMPYHPLYLPKDLKPIKFISKTKNYES